MKAFIFFLILFLVLNSTGSASGLQEKDKSSENALENIDAVQAIAIANQWKWSKKEIKSYVNSREVVFKFPDGRVKKFPLPEDKMLVAVAPYIRQTHK